MSGWESVADDLDRIAAGMGDPSRVRRAADRAAELIRAHIYEGDGFAPLSAATQAYRGAGRPLNDTGSLRDSITAEQTGADTATVGTAKPYAAIQNDGGTVTAKGGWLFIPAAGTRTLQRRYGHRPGDVIAGMKSAGFSVYRAGRTVCYRKKGRGSGKAPGKLLYYLKKSVTIPARRFFYLSDGEAADVLEEAMGELV